MSATTRTTCAAIDHPHLVAMLPPDPAREDICTRNGTIEKGREREREVEEERREVSGKEKEKGGDRVQERK